MRHQIAARQFLDTETPSLPPENSGETGISGGKRTTQTRSLSPESFQQQKDKLETTSQQLAQLLEQIKQREPEFTLTQKVEPIDITKFQQTLDTETAIIEWYIGNPNSNSNPPLLKGGWGGSDPSITTNNPNPNSNSNSPLLKGGRGGSDPSITTNNSNPNSNSPLLKGGRGGSDPSITTNNSNSDNSWGGSAFIITRNNIELVTYTTAEIAELETWKNDYLDEYRNKKTITTWQNTLSQKLEKLSEILRLNEIAAQIPETCKQLTLVPHRYLHLFPLHALQFTSETRFKQKTNFRGYLLDGFPDGVKYAPSLQLLELVKNRITTRKSTAQNQQQLFALQNPTEDLFNADMEVETIKIRFDLHQILLKKQATKIALNENRENLSNASYLHFSCHGVFNFDYPLLSSLVLADSLEPILEINPPQPPLSKGGLREENAFANGGLEEGLETKRYVTLRSGRKAIPEKCLTLREIFAELQLPQCSLVTLSACETGLTTSTAMTDEYIGLPSGFLYAGSMNVVSSLWAVDDFATAILMIKFYQELARKISVAVALNAAQNWMRAVSREDFIIWVGLLNLDNKSRQSVELWLICSREEQPFRDPKYWAAFCATGY
ncbi:MAG: CHAT domain-containing protein [Microcoleus sp.]